MPAWNLLTNGDFEAGDPPTGWTLEGAGATFSRSTTQVKIGTYSGKLIRSGTDCDIYEDLASPTTYRNKKVTLGAWIYATVANSVALYIEDDDGYSFTSYHSATPGWEWFTNTKTISGTATFVRCRLAIFDNDTTAYFDGAICVLGTSIVSTPFPVLICEVAWSNNPFDATPTWVDVSADFVSYNIKRGRQYEIDLFEAGTATITLLNHAGNYWMDNAGVTGIYSPNVKIGKRVRLSAFYNGIWYSRYVGYIESYTPVFGMAGLREPRMELQCGDALSLIARYVLNDSTGYLIDYSGNRVEDVLDTLVFPAADRALDTGIYYVQATGALTNANALDHIKSVCTTEIGLFYIDRSGIATFESRSHRTISPHTVSQGTFATNYPDIEISLDDHLLFNQVRATRTGGTEQVSNNSTSQTAYQIHALVRSGLLHTTNIATLIYACYLNARYATPKTRAVSISLLPTASPSTLFPYCLGFDFSTRITVTVPSPSGITDVDCFIENIEENYDATQPELWSFKWLLSNASGYLNPPVATTATIRPYAETDGSGGIVPVGGTLPVVLSDGDDATYVTNVSHDPAPWCECTLDSVVGGTGTISKITVYWRVKLVPFGTGNCDLFIVAGGTTDTPFDNYNGARTWETKSQDYALNPDTTAAWTWSDLESLIVGFKVNHLSPDDVYRCADIWVVIYFTPEW